MNCHPSLRKRTHLRTPGFSLLTCKHGLLKKVLAPLDADLVVVNLDDVD